MSNINPYQTLSQKLGIPFILLQKISTNLNANIASKIIKIKKKKRNICKASEELTYIHKIIKKYLDKKYLPCEINGYKKGCNQITNAIPHLNKKFILKIDIENFFPSIKFKKILAYYISCGFSKEESLLLTKLTSHNNSLPQGFSTSPLLANLIISNCIHRLRNFTKKYKITFTAYSDDLTFSSNKSLEWIKKVISLILKEEGFHINNEKIKHLNKRNSHKITGVICNSKINVYRKTYEIIKSILHNCKNYGAESQIQKYWEIFGESKSKEKSITKLKDRLEGKIQHIRDLNSQKSNKLKKNFHEINWSI